MRNSTPLSELPEQMSRFSFREASPTPQFFAQAIFWSFVLVPVFWLESARSIAAPTERLTQPALTEDALTQPALTEDAPAPSLSALSPALTIDLSSGIGRTSGIVSAGQQIYSFNAIAGNRITIDINVTQILPGRPFNDDDSQIFLFNSMGQLVAENDDDNRTYQSRLRNFIVPNDGTYFVAITTFNNDPIFDHNNVIIGWRENGGSNIRYDMTIITNIPRSGN